MAGRGSDQDAYTNKRSAIDNVFNKATPGVTTHTINNAEKGGAAGTYQVNHVPSHIALDTFQATSRKLADEESLEERPTTVPGIFVITETKTAIDERLHK